MACAQAFFLSYLDDDDDEEEENIQDDIGDDDDDSDDDDDEFDAGISLEAAITSVKNRMTALLQVG